MFLFLLSAAFSSSRSIERRTKSLPPVVRDRFNLFTTNASFSAFIFPRMASVASFPRLFSLVNFVVVLCQQFPVTEVPSTSHHQPRKQTAFVQLGLLHPRSVFVSIIICYIAGMFLQQCALIGYFVIT